MAKPLKRGWFDISCRLDSGDTGRVVIIPAGVVDLTGMPPVNMTAASAESIIAQFKTRGVDLVIDWEHATLVKGRNGEPAPAAGWIKDLEFDEEKGLVATVEFLPKTAAMIKAGEYKYLSPVFEYDTKTRDVMYLKHVGLTNIPRIENLPQLLAASMNLGDDDMKTGTGVANMEELKKTLVGYGVVQESATPDEVAAYMLGFLRDNMGDNSIACSVSSKLGLGKSADVKTIMAALDTMKIEAAKGPDYATIKARLDQLETERKATVSASLIERFTKEGKINPNNATAVAAAREFAQRDPENFTKYMEASDKVWEPGQTMPPPGDGTITDKQRSMISAALKEHEGNYELAIASLQADLKRPYLEQGLTNKKANALCAGRYELIFGNGEVN